MSKFKFELNKSSVRELLRGQETQAMLDGKAKEALSSLKEGYESDVYQGRNRANAMIWADTYQAKKDNLENNSILKSLR